MLGLNVYYVEKISIYFVKNLLKEISELKQTLKSLGMDVQKILPSPFSSKHIRVEVNYSIDKQSYLFSFSSSKSSEIKFKIVQGEPLPIPIFGVGDGKGYVNLTISNLTLADGKKKIYLDYSMLLTQNVFKEMTADIKGEAVKIVRNGIDNYNFKEQSEKRRYYSELVQILQEMGGLISDESTSELELDRFLEANPVVLEKGLNLVKLQHQVVLENLLQKYEHNLKPDLIAFDLAEKNWTIVDYKKSKKVIMKNIGKVRSGLKSEVHDLRYQLKDYIEYFEENVHREYVLKTYKIELKYPYGIGIIGNVNDKERDEFNRVMKDEPKWFKVTPYNYLFDNFNRYVDDFSKTLT